MEAVDNVEGKIRVEKLVKSCEEVMTAAFSEHEELCPLADKTAHPDALKNDLEKWLSDVTVENDEVLEKAWECIDGAPEIKKNFLCLPLKLFRKPSRLHRLSKRPIV